MSQKKQKNRNIKARKSAQRFYASGFRRILLKSVLEARENNPDKENARRSG